MLAETLLLGKVCPQITIYMVIEPNSLLFVINGGRILTSMIFLIQNHQFYKRTMKLYLLILPQNLKKMADYMNTRTNLLVHVQESQNVTVTCQKDHGALQALVKYPFLMTLGEGKNVLLIAKNLLYPGCQHACRYHGAG